MQVELRDTVYSHYSSAARNFVDLGMAILQFGCSFAEHRRIWVVAMGVLDGGEYSRQHFLELPDWRRSQDSTS